MQIKDLSVKVERLDEVRGGVGDVSVYQTGATVYASQSSTIGGSGQTSLYNSPVTTSQYIEANTLNKAFMPIKQVDVHKRSFVANNSNFEFKVGGFGRLVREMD